MTELRCKAGQLAIIIKSTAGNEGMIVRTVRLRAHSAFSFPVEHGPVWEIDTPILTSAGNMVPACYDEWMRPVEGLSEEELVELGVEEEDIQNIFKESVDS